MHRTQEQKTGGVGLREKREIFKRLSRLPFAFLS